MIAQWDMVSHSIRSILIIFIYSDWCLRCLYPYLTPAWKVNLKALCI